MVFTALAEEVGQEMWTQTKIKYKNNALCRIKDYFWWFGTSFPALVYVGEAIVFILACWDKIWWWGGDVWEAHNGWERSGKRWEGNKAVAARPPFWDGCTHLGKSLGMKQYFHLLMYLSISTSFPSLRIHITQRGYICMGAKSKGGY